MYYLSNKEDKEDVQFQHRNIPHKKMTCQQLTAVSGS
jgi:hypothetical protein